MSRRAGVLAALAGTVLVAGLLLVAPRTPLTRGLAAPDVPGAVAGSGEDDADGGGDNPFSGPGPDVDRAHPPGRPIVADTVHHDTSKPLRSIKPEPAVEGDEDADANAPLPLPGRAGSTPRAGRDPVAQDGPVAQAITSNVVTGFDGVTDINNVVPPDTNGDIGPNNYVQWVNLSFAIYDRAGTLLYGPAAGNTLWTGFGAPCANTNSGDPIAQYDHLADRWVMSQFALPNYPNGPFYMCLAVSQTGDPLGSWNRYAFLISNTKLDDYPHLTVWPDAYYLSINQFQNGWAGQGAVAFERSKMLAGQSARGVYFDLFGVDPNLGGMLPSDLDGPAPPNGAPNVYVEADDDGSGAPHDQLQLWSFHVDWTTPANSTFTHTATLQTAAMDTNLCGYARSCIPQPPFNVNKTQGLDALADRIMYRLQYRNFGAYQTLVTTQSVDTDGADHAGIRWFEVRNSGAGWTIRQQGTWAPDASDRWLGSAAMNGGGDIGIGYSLSSSSIYPSIEFAGRLAADPLGTLTTTETSIIAGGGTQTATQARWGDYSMLAVDPTDDCTFWYTNEYLAVTGTAPWRTRIAAIRLPSCGGSGGDFTPPAASSFAPTTPTPTNSATLSYALTFSESVTGLTAADFTTAGTATGCGVNAPSGSGASYTVTVSGCGTGTVNLRLKANSVVDAATNLGPVAAPLASTITVDRTAPTASITGPTSPTSAVVLPYDITFSETISGLAATDFSVGGTATGCSVGSPTGSGPNWAVVLSGCSEGTVSLTLLSGSVTDAVTNAGPPSNVISSTLTVDRTGPTATVTRPAATTNASVVSFAVAFSEPVTILDLGDFGTGGTATGCSIGPPTGTGASYSVPVSGCSAGTLSLTLHAFTVSDAATNSGPAVDVTSGVVTIDRTAPTVTTPAATLRSNLQLNGSTLSLQLGWVAADAGGAGLTTCDVGRSTDGAAFVTVLTGVACGPTSTANVGAISTHSYRFEVRAHDAAGNVGGWLAGPTLKPSLLQQTSSSIVYHGTWTSSSSSSFSGGSAKYATAAGAYASYTFTGRAVAFVTTRAAARGSVKIYLDGVLVTTLSCNASTTTYRWVGFSQTWATSATHTIKWVIVGTAGHPRVDLDAIEVVH